MLVLLGPALLFSTLNPTLTDNLITGSSVKVGEWRAIPTLLRKKSPLNNGSFSLLLLVVVVVLLPHPLVPSYQWTHRVLRRVFAVAVQITRPRERQGVSKPGQRNPYIHLSF